MSVMSYVSGPCSLCVGRLRVLDSAIQGPLCLAWRGADPLPDKPAGCDGYLVKQACLVGDALFSKPFYKSTSTNPG